MATQISFDEMATLVAEAVQHPDFQQCFDDDELRIILSDDPAKPYQRLTSPNGYPRSPFYKHIADVLSTFLKSGVAYVNQRPKLPLLDEGSYVIERQSHFYSVQDDLTGLLSLWEDFTAEEKRFRVRSVLLRLQRRGILDLLGVRKTQGTRDLLPPLRSTLLESFNAPHSEKSILTVGARALTKHHHRDSSTSFWGVCTGSEAAKNEHALRVVTIILDYANWINIHELPGQLPILEIRGPGGYGARWAPDGKTFRGFLEPMMEEGWAVGYHH